MKSKNPKIQNILKKGILLVLTLAIMLPSCIYATEGLTLQESTALEKLMYGEIGSVVRKIEEHFKSNTTLYIVNETQLRALAEYVNAGNLCYGKEIELLNDITLDNNIDWTPIGTEYAPFKGTFNGNGHTISKLSYLVSETNNINIGLFGVSSGIIKNVTIKNSKIKKATSEYFATDIDYSNIGNIVGLNNGIVINCSANTMPLGITKVNIGTDSNKYVGAIAGKSETSRVIEEDKLEISDVTVNKGTDTIKIVPKIYIKQGNTDYKEIKDFTDIVYLKQNYKVKLEIEIDKYIFTGLENGNKIKLADVKNEEGEITQKASEEIYPRLTLGDLVFTPISATQEEITTEDENKVPRTTLVYELSVEETDKEFTAKYVTMNFAKNLNNDNLYVYYDERANDFDTENEFERNAIYNFGNVNIKVDTKNPSVNIKAYLEEETASKRYTEGKEIIIEVTSTEKIKATTAPELEISFSKSGVGKYNYKENATKGNAKNVDAIIDADGTTKWTYSYIIIAGDEGTLSIDYLNGTIKDLSDNTSNLSTFEDVIIESIYADTTAPTVQIIKDIEGSITNKDSITYEFKWSEKLAEFTKDNITVNNGTKGELSSVIENEDGTYSYTMTVTPNVESGNVGELQVIVEQNVCKDLAGLGNARSENLITVDKKSPILLNLEAYATSNITLDKEIDTVKEYYKTNETITIVATFDENIVLAQIPTLSLQFSESGNAKGTVSGVVEGNKIIYTYNLANGDKGVLSVKGLSGTITDNAGNETKVTKRTLDGDTIIADTIAPNLKELQVTTNEGTYNAGKNITIEAQFDEEVYAIKDNEIKNITSGTAPVLKVKFGNAEEKIASVSGYGTKEDGTKDKTKIIYTCQIEEGENGELQITSIQNAENVEMCDIAGNIATLIKRQTGNTIIADTIAPEVTNITAEVKYPTISGTEIYHKEGNDIKITLTFSEKVSSAVLMPKILIGFSESEDEEPEAYNTYAYESNWNVNSTTIEYTYSIKNGDNGYLWVKVPAEQFKDQAGNKNVAKDATKLSNVYADTILPTITLLKDTEVNQANQTITVKATFSEDVYDLNNNTRISLSQANAPKLIYSFGTGSNKEVSATSISGAIITYVIAKDPVNDNGTLHYELAKGNLCDRAGNEYYQETTDTTAPVLERVYITSNSEYGVYCKAGTEIYVTAEFNEKISNQNMKLKIRIGSEGQEKEISGLINQEDSTKIKFTYTVLSGDNGEFKIVDITGNTQDDENLEDKTYGYVKDLYGNQTNIYNLNGYTVIGKAIADTIAPTLEITSDVERTNKDTITYTFTWSETVTGFTANDIEVINGIKGDFETVLNTNGKVYRLTVDILEEGRQIIKVNSNVCTDLAGNANKERTTFNKVYVDYTKPIIRAKLNGGNYVLGTDSEKSEVTETIIVNEELSKFEYIWSTSETLPETGWTEVDLSNILVNSDINLKSEFTEEKTYYLYIKAIDEAGNETNVKTKGFVISNQEIKLTADTTQITNKDVTVTAEYGEGLTENRKAGISGKTQSADSTKIIVPENGIVYAEATDRAGNKVYKKLEITNIDKTAPEATIQYTANNETNTVTAKISFNEETTITNNNGSDEYVFTENGEFTFEFKDKAGNTGTATATVTSIIIIEEDKTAPVITFKYTLTTTTVGNSIGATIVTDEDAIISYSWDNENWTTSQDYVRNQNAIQAPTRAGAYILYAKATDKANNESEVKKLEFTILDAIEDEKELEAEIIFEDLVTVQIDGTKYVKISSNITSETITNKMHKDALNGKTPKYDNLTEDHKLKTGSTISIDGKTKYVIIVNGDVNCDGKVTFLGDIVTANNYRIGINKNLSTMQLLAADINNSGNIEFIPDIVAMNNYRLGKINSL